MRDEADNGAASWVRRKYTKVGGRRRLIIFFLVCVIFILLIGIPIFVRLFFRKNSKDSNVTDRMLEWQQKKHDDRVKKQHSPWTGE